MYGVAPITSRAKAFPLHIPLPKDLTIKGDILFEHHRMMDLEKRRCTFVEKAPKELIDECTSKLKLLY